MLDKLETKRWLLQKLKEHTATLTIGAIFALSPVMFGNAKILQIDKKKDIQNRIANIREKLRQETDAVNPPEPPHGNRALLVQWNNWRNS